MRFRVLGTIEVIDTDGAPARIGSPNQRRILAVMLAHTGEVVPIDTLTDAVWGDSTPASGVATLRTYVSRLRTVIGAHLATQGAGYTLTADPLEIDAGRFEALLRQAPGVEPPLGAALLDEALALWHGPAFADHAEVESIAPEARRLDELRRGAIEAHISALRGAGRVDEAVAEAEALVTSDPLREGAWGALIEALAAQGRTAEALRAFQRAGDTLAESGLEPSPALREVERAVLAGEVVRPDRGAAARLRPLTPLPASSFVGRDEDCTAVMALLEHERVVTLVGPGGVGKTRLALEVARLATASSTRGASIAELARLPDGSGVPDAVVGALGLASEGEAPLDALDRAGTLDVLLVLDNAEHVIDAAAETVERLIGGGDAIGVLVTSREPLGVDGEHVWPVEPLSVDQAGSPARRLFVQRAAAAAPDLALDIDDAIVARVVARLDGLPLAIEMAAAQLPTTSIGELADALDGRLDELRSPRRHAPARHQTLGGVLEWSEARLDDEEQRTLASLSVFAGPVTAEDIVGVLDDPHAATIVRSLVTRSLVRADRAVTPAHYSLLQTVRDFAAARARALGIADDLARRHAHWFVGIAQSSDAQLRSVDEGVAAARMDGAFADFRAAHRWAREHELGLAATLSAALHQYSQNRLAEEPMRWATLIVDDLPDNDPNLATVLATVATHAANRSDISAARQLARRAIALDGPARARMSAYEVLGDACLYSGRLVESRAAYNTLTELAREEGDSYYEVVGRSSVAMTRIYAGEPPDEDLCDLGGPDVSPMTNAWVAYTQGEALAGSDPVAATASYEQAIAFARSVGGRFVEGVALVSLCALQARVADVSTALDQFADVIRHWLRLADHVHQLTTLRNLAMLLRRTGDAAATAELLGAVEREDTTSYGEEAERLAAVAEWARVELGDNEFEARIHAGRARDVTAAAEWALALIGSDDILDALE